MTYQCQYKDENICPHKDSYMSVQCHFVILKTKKIPNVHPLMKWKNKTTNKQTKTTTTKPVVNIHNEIFIRIKRKEQLIQATTLVHL